MWEEGTSDQDGIFRMGYPFIAVDIHDLTHGVDPEHAAENQGGRDEVETERHPGSSLTG